MTTITFVASTTTVVGTWDIHGSPSDLVTVTSATAAPHFLVASSGFVYAYYLDLSYSQASPAETWYAIHSTDSGNNTGWIFGAPEGDTYYIPEDFPDLPTALLAMSDGDTLVFHTSAAVQTNDITTALNFITLRAGDGYTPVLDHTDAAAHGLEVTGNGWTLEGITFRSRTAGQGGTALILDGTVGQTLTGCAFQGSPTALGGNFVGTVSACEFRNISVRVCDSISEVLFEACQFLRCTGTEVIDCPTTGVVINCTFIQCVTSDTMCDVDICDNNTAQGCTATGYIFEGTTRVNSCNAFDCTGSLGNFNGGSEAGNTTVDPQHVNLYNDLRLLPASALIRAGDNTLYPTSDFNGAAYQDPPTVGAHESIVIAGAAATSAETLTATLTGTYIEAEVEDVDAWTVTNTTNGVNVAVLSVVWAAPVATLTTWPAMSPGIEYTVTADFGGYGYDSATFTPSVAYATSESEPYRNVAAYANAAGWQLLAIAGTAETTLAYALEVGDQTAYVQSTLGFADEGTLFVGTARITYTSKTDATFHGLVEAVPRTTPIPLGTAVAFDEASFYPEP